MNYWCMKGCYWQCSATCRSSFSFKKVQLPFWNSWDITRIILPFRSLSFQASYWWKPCVAERWQLILKQRYMACYRFLLVPSCTRVISIYSNLAFLCYCLLLLYTHLTYIFFQISISFSFYHYGSCRRCFSFHNNIPGDKELIVRLNSPKQFSLISTPSPCSIGMIRS